MPESHVGNESLDTLACFYLRRLQSGSQKWYFVSKIVLMIEENLFKFEAEGQEFANILRSLEQFIRTVKEQFWKMLFNLFLVVF